MELLLQQELLHLLLKELFYMNKQIDVAQNNKTHLFIVYVG